MVLITKLSRFMLYFSLVFILYTTGFGWQFVHITDSHIGTKQGDKNLQELIPVINQMKPKPAFIINTGDITNLGTEPEFSLYSLLIHQFDIPVYNVLGNHEVRWSDGGKLRFEHYFGKRYYSFNYRKLHFIVLDDSITLQNHGHFFQNQLDWLKSDLASLKKNTPVIIGFHHWPLREANLVDNGNMLFDVIRPYNVIAMIIGHGHVNRIETYENITLLMTKGMANGGYKLFDVSDKEITAYNFELGKTIASDTIKIPLKRIIPPAPEMTASVKLHPEIIWQTRIDDGLQFPPASGDGKLFYGTNAGYLFALDTGSGKTVWKIRVNGTILSSPLYQSNTIYFTSLGGAVYAVSASDGSLIWKYQTLGSIISPPQLANGMIYFSSGDFNFYAIDAKTGTLKWKYGTDKQATAKANVSFGKVYFGTWGGKAYGLDGLTGMLDWTDPIGDSTYLWSPAITDPITVDSTIVFSAYEMVENHLKSRVFSIDAFSGKTVWSSYTRSFVTNPVYLDDTVYVFCQSQHIVALDGKTGETIWTTPVKNSVLASNVANKNGKFYIPMFQGELRIFDPISQQELCLIPISKTGFLFSGPIIIDDVCYQSAFDGTVVAIPINRN